MPTQNKTSGIFHPFAARHIWHLTLSVAFFPAIGFKDNIVVRDCRVQFCNTVFYPIFIVGQILS